MYGIHYKLYGLEWTNELGQAIERGLIATCPKCNGNCSCDTICELCAIRNDGFGILPDYFDAFWTTYSGDESRPVVLGVEFEEAAEFDSKSLQEMFTGKDIPNSVKEKYQENFDKLPQELQNEILKMGLTPTIVFSRGTS